MFASIMATSKRLQKDYEAFLEDIVRRMLILEKDIHILLISRPDAAALFGCSVRHLDRILVQCHVGKVHMPASLKEGENTSFIRWGDLVDSIFVRQYYDIPALKDGTGHLYCDEFERAYAEFWNERKDDLK